MNGTYDRALGKAIAEIIQEHEEVLKPELEKAKMTISECLQNPSLIELDDKITAPLFGFKDRDDYYRTAACFNRIPNIKRPTFFLNALDDPIIGDKSINYEVFDQNENTILGTTKHGGHIGYHESFFKKDQWFLEPAFDFLNQYK